MDRGLELIFSWDAHSKSHQARASETPQLLSVSPIFKLLGNSHMRVTEQFTITQRDHADTQALFNWVTGSFLELESMAQSQVDGYWEQLRAGRIGRKLKERGTLGLRLRSRANGSFSVEWYECGFLGNSNKPIARKHIRKGKNNRYPIKSLMQGQPEWLLSIVSETEFLLAEIRKRQALLVNIRDAGTIYAKAVEGRSARPLAETDPSEEMLRKPAYKPSTSKT